MNPSKYSKWYLPCLSIHSKSSSLSCIPLTSNSHFSVGRLSCEFFTTMAPMIHLALVFICRAFLLTQSGCCSQYTLCCPFLLQTLFVRPGGSCSPQMLSQSCRLFPFPLLCLDNQDTQFLACFSVQFEKIFCNLS